MYDFSKSIYSSRHFPAVNKAFSEFFTAETKTGTEIAQVVGGYEKIVKFVENITPDIMGYINEEFEKSTPQFNVLCHGDCWGNNMLSR